ncbi:hypothetical protein ACP4OV_026488 [Aristida adscensionis]
MSSSRAEAAAAVRRAGALVAAAAALGLLFVLFPTAQGRNERFTLTTTPLMFATLLLGCAAVLLSPAHRAVAEHARRAADASRENFHALRRAAVEPRWAGFTCIVFYTLHAAGDMPEAAAAEVSVQKVDGLILFLVFLVGVWTVTLSLRTRRAPRPAAEEELDGGQVNAATTPAKGLNSYGGKTMDGGLFLSRSENRDCPYFVP